MNEIIEEIQEWQKENKWELVPKKSFPARARGLIIGFLSLVTLVLCTSIPNDTIRILTLPICLATFGGMCYGIFSFLGEEEE